MGGLEGRHQLGLEPARLLGVQVTDLLWHINERGDGLVVALLGSLVGDTASSADLNRELLALGVSNKLARLLLNILGGTAGLIDGPALLGSLAVAHLLKGPVALLDLLLLGLLLKGDLAGLLKVLLTDLLLGGVELCHVGVVALLDVLVGALEDGVFLEGGDSLLSLDTAETGVGVILAGTEVNTGATVLLPGRPGETLAVPVVVVVVVTTAITTD